MKKHAKWIVALAAIAALTAYAVADLTPWKDYTVSDAVWMVTTVKVDANMNDAYLEGLSKTWIPSNEASKELGHIEDWKILRSQLPNSGQLNLLLMVKFKDISMVGPDKARYEALVKKRGEKNVKSSTEFAQKNYPAMRDITGQYMMREVNVK